MHKLSDLKFVLPAQPYQSDQIQQDERAGYVRTEHFSRYISHRPISVTTRSNACPVFYHSNTGIMGSNSTRGTGVFSVFLLPYVGTGLATGLSPSQGILPNVYKQDFKPKTRETLHRVGQFCHTRTNHPLSATPNLLYNLTVVILLHITNNVMIF
jgi:hypothetical protein